jgi:hypothetical protein
MFLAIESVLVVVAILAFCGLYGGYKVPWLIGLLITLTLWHVVAVPICFFYLIGKPIVMTLVPLFPSRESRTLRRELRQRADLTDEEFYARHYQNSGIPSDIPTGVRHMLIAVDPLFQRAIPTDCIWLLYDEWDPTAEFRSLEKEFNIRLAKKDLKSFAGTLDGLIQLVHRLKKP